MTKTTSIQTVTLYYIVDNASGKVLSSFFTHKDDAKDEQYQIETDRERDAEFNQKEKGK